MRRAAAVGLGLFVCACSGSAELADAGPDAGADAADATSEPDVVDAAPDVPIDRWVAPVKPWQRMPVADYLGGALLTSMKVITVTYASDDAALVARMQTFGDTITQTPWWTASTAEYCVLPAGSPCIGPGSSGGHVVLNEAAPATLVDTDDGNGSSVVQFIQDHITSGAFPPPDDQTIYQIYFPTGTTITFDGGKSCSSFGAYHYSATFSVPDGGTVEGAYAIEPRCSGEPYITMAASHELIEAATDAHPGKVRGYVMQDLSWNRLGDEVGDLCDHPWSFDTMVESTFTVQRGWSNVSALAGHDPCVIAPATPYFNAAPESGKQTVYLSVGESADIELQAFSDGTTPDWALSGVDLGPIFGAGQTLTFSFDKTTVNDGDVAHMTVTLSKKPTSAWVPYAIDSKGNGKEHQWGASVILK
jgi:hypothetical protein